MKKLILVLALIFAIAMPGFAVGGTYTDNGYFYLPAYGAYGTDEFAEYNTYMQTADDQIEANKTNSFSTINTEAKLEAAISDMANIIQETEIDTFSKLNAIVADKTLTKAEDWDTHAELIAILNIGIIDDYILEVDGSPNNDEYARFTANGLEGRTEAEFKGDFNLEIDTDIQQDITNIVLCSNYDHPDDAITAIASANKTLLVTEAETCDANFTVPANVTVKFERGGKWTINNGVTVTFNGQIDAELWEIFTYVGTGTLAGTPQVKSVNVKWFGAVGDGTDDSTAVQNAFDFLDLCPDSRSTPPQEDYSGGILFFPKGMYKFDNIDVRMGSKIIGTGLWNTRISSYTNTNPAFNITSTPLQSDGHACIFENIYFWGGDWVTHDTPVINYSTLTSIVFNNCWFDSNYALKFTSCTEVTIQNCIFDGGYAQINCISVVDLKIINNIFYATDKYCIKLDTVTQATVTNNNFIDIKAYMVYADGSDDIIISNNNVDYDASTNTDKTILLTGTCDNINICDNIFKATQLNIFGIHSTGTTSLTIGNNYFKNYDYSIYAYSTKAFINNNIITNNNHMAIKIGDNSDVNIYNNRIIDVNVANSANPNLGSAIWLNNSTGKILQNRVKNDIGTPIHSGITVSGTADVIARYNVISNATNDILTFDTAQINLTNQSQMTFEGTTNDVHETTLVITEPTQDNDITFPNSDETVGVATSITDGLVLRLLGNTTVAFNADADTTLYTVPTGKRCVLSHAIIVAAGDAGATTTVSIGANGTETDFVPANTLSNLDAQYDSVILQPIPNTTPLKIKSYAAATVIEARVASQSGVAGNTIYLFGILY